MPEKTDDVQTGRQVAEVTDSGDVYASRAVAAGPLVFFGGTAYGAEGDLAQDAMVEPPYHLSPAAAVTAQGSYLFDRIAGHLEALGSEMDQIVQVEQFIPAKAYADGHVTNRSRYLATARPTTMMGATGPVAPEGAVLAMFGIAARPAAGCSKELAPLPPGEAGGAIDWSQLGEAYKDGPPYTDVVLAGPYVFVTGDVTLDATTGQVEAAARVADWIWAGSEARNEAAVLLERLALRLQRLGAALDEVVHVTLFVTDIADIYEIDQSWERLFGPHPPARTVVPVRGLGVPRREGTGMGHGDRAVKLEHQVRAIRPDQGVTIERLQTPAGRLAFESEAVKAGSLVWLSHQYPRTTAGASVETQVDEVLAQVAQVCTEAGTSLDSLAQLRVFCQNESTAGVVAAKLRQLIPHEPPVVGVMTVPGPLLVPGAELFVDGVIQVP